MLSSFLYNAWYGGPDATPCPQIDSPPLPINKGLAEAVGVSNYGAEQLARIHDYLDARGVPLASAQVQYSLLSRGGAQESVRREAEERGIALIAYSPLALGERRA